MKKIIAGISIAVVFWFIMFSPWTKDYVNFWVIMLIAASSLSVFSLIAGKDELKSVYRFKPRYILIGLISALLLYLIFYAGNQISNLIFDFSKEQVENIYATKSQADDLYIALALLFVIGPAEEIFWRGFVQKDLMEKTGNLKGLLLTAGIYALVHIWSFNFILVMAALICGLFWGFIFYKYKSVVPAIISHAVWDALIFVIIPISF